MSLTLLRSRLFLYRHLRGSKSILTLPTPYAAAHGVIVVWPLRGYSDPYLNCDKNGIEFFFITYCMWWLDSQTRRVDTIVTPGETGGVGNYVGLGEPRRCLPRRIAGVILYCIVCLGERD